MDSNVLGLWLGLASAFVAVSGVIYTAWSARRGTLPSQTLAWVNEEYGKREQSEERADKERAWRIALQEEVGTLKLTINQINEEHAGAIKESIEYALKIDALIETIKQRDIAAARKVDSLTEMIEERDRAIVDINNRMDLMVNENAKLRSDNEALQNRVNELEMKDHEKDEKIAKLKQQIYLLGGDPVTGPFNQGVEKE